MLKVLKIEASARCEGSISRLLTNSFVETLGIDMSAAGMTTRDLADGMPLLNEEWIGANFTPADQRTEEQSAVLAFSDELLDEVETADVILIGLPMYNFSVPASFKAWIDQIARVGRSFHYTENGPVGLLKNKQVVVIQSTGGTPIGSENDFSSTYVRFVLGFMGMNDVTFINADKVGQNAAQVLKEQASAISTLATNIAAKMRTAA